MDVRISTNQAFTPKYRYMTYFFKKKDHNLFTVFFSRRSILWTGYRNRFSNCKKKKKEKMRKRPQDPLLQPPTDHDLVWLVNIYKYKYYILLFFLFLFCYFLISPNSIIIIVSHTLSSSGPLPHPSPFKKLCCAILCTYLCIHELGI